MAISVAYYSLTGNHERLANHVAERLRCGLIRIAETSPRTALKTSLDLLFGRLPRIESIDATLDAYEHVVLVAPVWSSKLAPPLASFIARERHQLPEYSFITLSGEERPGQGESLLTELTRRVGRKPQAFCELYVADLPPREQPQKLGAASPPRIRAEELEHYDASIDEFLIAAGFEVKQWRASGASLRQRAMP